MNIGNNIMMIHVGDFLSLFFSTTFIFPSAISFLPSIPFQFYLPAQLNQSDKCVQDVY